jgi:IS30 family transposase
MNGNGAEAGLDSFTRQMKRLPAAMRKSMTYDRGFDPLMVCAQTTAEQWTACHPELARRLKIDIWFCDPHAPLSSRARQRLPGSAWQSLLKRKHQRLAPPVHAKRNRPRRCEPDLTQRRCSPAD